MTEPNTPNSYARANSDYRWTGAKAVAFLHALARTGSAAKAARAVGMSRQSAYRLRARAAEFAALWDEGLALRRRLGPPPAEPLPGSQGDTGAAQGDRCAPR